MNYYSAYSPKKYMQHQIEMEMITRFRSRVSRMTLQELRVELASTEAALAKTPARWVNRRSSLSHNISSLREAIERASR